MCVSVSVSVAGILCLAFHRSERLLPLRIKPTEEFAGAGRQRRLLGFWLFVDGGRRGSERLRLGCNVVDPGCHHGTSDNVVVVVVVVVAAAASTAAAASSTAAGGNSGNRDRDCGSSGSGVMMRSSRGVGERGSRRNDFWSDGCKALVHSSE
jgi:hypothetical protein